jgi:hypothetical protein
MQVLVIVDLNDALHVLFLDEIDDLAAIGYDLEGLARHDYFLVIKDLPVLEASHNSSENLIEVFVHGRVLVA